MYEVYRIHLCIQNTYHQTTVRKNPVVKYPVSMNPVEIIPSEMNPVLLESRQNWIPSNTNPVEGESRQNWIPSKVNPVLNKSRQKWIPSENESRQMWIPPKTNPTRNRYKSQYRRTLLSWREVESLSYYMKLWRSDPRLRPQTASDGLRGRIWGRGLKRPQVGALKYEEVIILQTGWKHDTYFRSVHGQYKQYPAYFR